MAASDEVPGFTNCRYRRHFQQDWARYGCAHVVHQPAQMTVQELERGFLRCWQEFYREADMDAALGCFNGDRLGPSARIHRA